IAPAGILSTRSRTVSSSSVGLGRGPPDFPAAALASDGPRRTTARVTASAFWDLDLPQPLSLGMLRIGFLMTASALISAAALLLTYCIARTAGKNSNGREKDFQTGRMESGRQLWYACGQ